MAAFSDRWEKNLAYFGIKNEDNIEPAKDVLQKSLIHLVSHLRDNGYIYSDVNREDEEGITALHHAVSKNNDMMVNALLENGADINKQNKEGKTALFQAVEQVERRGESKMVSLLLKKKADPNITFNGWTPLMEASAKGCKNVVKQLLLYGANVLTEDAEGRNAYDWTDANPIYDRQGMMDILKEFSAKKANLIALERQIDEDLSMVSAFLEPRCTGSIEGLAEMVIDFPSVQALIPQDSGTDIESVEAKPSTYARNSNADSD